MSDPRVTLDKKEVIEGGVVVVNCSVPEEKAPVHFTIEKFELNIRSAKKKREKDRFKKLYNIPNSSSLNQFYSSRRYNRK